MSFSFGPPPSAAAAAVPAPAGDPFGFGPPSVDAFAAAPSPGGADEPPTSEPTTSELTLLDSVLDKTVKNGAVGAKQINGLGRTCRYLKSSVLENDSVWKWICTFDEMTRDPVKHMPAALVATRGHKWLYQRLTTTRQTGTAEGDRWWSDDALPPPELSCDDIGLAIDISYQEKPVISKMITGDELSKVFDEGLIDIDLEPKAKLKFDTPFFTTTSESWIYQDNEVVYAPDENLASKP